MLSLAVWDPGCLVYCHSVVHCGAPRSQRPGAGTVGRGPRSRVLGAGSGEQTVVGGSPEAGGEEDGANGASAGPVGARSRLLH